MTPVDDVFGEEHDDEISWVVQAQAEHVLHDWCGDVAER